MWGSFTFGDVEDRERDEVEEIIRNRKSRKKKKTSKWNQLYFQRTKVLEEKQLTGPKKRPIRKGHKLFKELSCFKCEKTFHKRISLELHRAELHKNDLQKISHSKSKRSYVDNVDSFTGASSTSEDFSDIELSKKFKDDVKDETEDELFSSDDEFNEAWEKENLPEPKEKGRGPNTNKRKGLNNLPEVQAYKKGEWEWMINHNLFTPEVVLGDSLNKAMRLNTAIEATSKSDNSLDFESPNKDAQIASMKSDESLQFDDIESILGPDSDEETTYKSEMKYDNSVGNHEKQIDCDKIVLNDNNKIQENIQDESNDEDSQGEQVVSNLENRYHSQNEENTQHKQRFSLYDHHSQKVVFKNNMNMNQLQSLYCEINKKFENEENCLDNDSNREDGLCTPEEHDDIVCISLSSSDSEEASDDNSNLNTANKEEPKHEVFSDNDEGLKLYESDPRFNCHLILRDFVAGKLLDQLKMKYNFKFTLPDMFCNTNNKMSSNDCDTDLESSTGGSCIVLSSSSDDSDDDEVLPADYDDYSDEDDCYLIEDEECHVETNLPHTLPNILIENDIIEIDD